MKMLLRLSFFLFISFAYLPLFADQSHLKIHTYASQPRLHDSVNVHWIETRNSLIVIDTQRLISESNRAIKHIKSFNKPVKAIFITHAHSDHYGGLPIFKKAFPNAKIYSNQTTIDSIKNDNRGYTAARKKALSEDFVSQTELSKALPRFTLKDGDIINIEDITIKIYEVEAGESEKGIVLYLPEYKILFAADNVNNGYVPAPLESLDQWLLTLKDWESRYPKDTLAYIGHGPHGNLQDLVINQLEYLTLLRDEVKMALKDKVLSSREIDEISFRLERNYPHLHGVGGNSRLNVIKFIVGHVAKQYGGTVEAKTSFR